MASDLRASAENVRAGKGPLGALIFSEKLSRAMDDLADTSASVKAVLREIEKGEGAAHSLVYDPKDRKIPVRDWMEKQGRFKHLFKPQYAYVIDEAQAYIDKEWEHLKSLVSLSAGAGA